MNDMAKGPMPGDEFEEFRAGAGTDDVANPSLNDGPIPSVRFAHLPASIGTFEVLGKVGGHGAGAIDRDDAAAVVRASRLCEFGEPIQSHLGWHDLCAAIVVADAC